LLHSKGKERKRKEKKGKRLHSTSIGHYLYKILADSSFTDHPTIEAVKTGLE
jgi:hypothetical protein